MSFEFIKKQCLLIAAFACGASAFAADNFKLSCDDNNIFEAPMDITIKGPHATAKGMFSGPGDALFTVDYKSLDTINLRSPQNDDSKIAEVTLAQPRLVEDPTKFELPLKANSAGELKGHLTMISTDSDHQPYDGDVVCKILEAH